MALNTAEQLKILNGEVKPQAGSFKDMVHQLSVGVVTALAGSEIPFVLTDGAVTFPPAPEGVDVEKAYSYQQKMKRFSLSVIQGSDAVKQQMQKVVVSFMSVEAYSYDTLDLIPDSGTLEAPGWSQLIGQQIVKTFELLALTEPGEPEAFKALAASLAG